MRITEIEFIEALSILSGISFICYGLLCLTTRHMEKEFQHYGLSRFRKLTGALELLGGAGLFVGIYFPIIRVFSALGLAVLMLMGCFVRLKVKDHLALILPAFVLMIINFYLFIHFFTLK
jgi:hypothetical protein